MGKGESQFTRQWLFTRSLGITSPTNLPFQGPKGDTPQVNHGNEFIGPDICPHDWITRTAVSSTSLGGPRSDVSFHQSLGQTPLVSSLVHNAQRLITLFPSHSYILQNLRRQSSSHNKILRSFPSLEHVTVIVTSAPIGQEFRNTSQDTSQATIQTTPASPTTHTHHAYYRIRSFHSPRPQSLDHLSRLASLVFLLASSLTPILLQTRQ